MQIGLFTPDFVTGSIIGAHTNCGKSYETNSEAATNTNNNPIDDKWHESFNTSFSTAANELNQQTLARLPTGCKSLDNLLDGGIEASVITQVYGPPGSGKTQLCHTLSVMLPSDYNAIYIDYDYRVIYIDTEGSFRPERIEAIAKASGFGSKQILQKILVAKALDSEHLESCIEGACSACEKNKIPLNIGDLLRNYQL